MAQKDEDFTFYRNFSSGSLNASAGSTGSGVAVNVTGFDRVLHMVNFTNLTGSTGSPSVYAMQCATYGGTYAQITGGSAIGSERVTSGSGVVSVDVPTSSTYPWQKVYINANSGSCFVGGIAILYGGSKTNPPDRTIDTVYVD